MKKAIFIDEHKQLDVMKDYKRYLKKMEELKHNLVELNKNSKIKDKTYLLDYIEGGEDYEQLSLLTMSVLFL